MYVCPFSSQIQSPWKLLTHALNILQISMTSYKRCINRILFLGTNRSYYVIWLRRQSQKIDTSGNVPKDTAFKDTSVDNRTFGFTYLWGTTLSACERGRAWEHALQALSSALSREERRNNRNIKNEKKRQTQKRQKQNKQQDSPLTSSVGNCFDHTKGVLQKAYPLLRHKKLCWRTSCLTCNLACAAAAY